jgi:hypothetical protein
VVGCSFPNKQKVFHVRKHLALPSRGIRSFLSTKLFDEVLGHPFCIRDSWILLKVSLLSSSASSASSSFISSIFESSPAPVAFKFTNFYSNHFNCLFIFRYFKSPTFKMQYSSIILIAAFAATNVFAHGVIDSVVGANGVTMPGLSGMTSISSSS